MTSCAYCDVNSPQSLVQCLICEKWFCNGTGKPDSHSRGSHIITHLVLSKHNRVALHPDSPLGDSPLECYNCGSQNIFVLGFVSAKQENVVVLLCRLPCAQQKDLNWDTQNWQSLIEDRHLVKWLCKLPTDEDLLSAHDITYQQINLLEKNWRINKTAQLTDLIEESPNDELPIDPILLRYEDAYQYQNAFAPLVKIEADYDKSLKDSNSLNYISVDWSLAINNKYLAKFYFSNVDSLELKVSVGDEMILRYDGPELDSPWEGHGYIIKLPDAYQEEFTLELNPSKIKPPIHIFNRFTIEFVWKGISYDRMQEALKNFAIKESSVSKYIYNKLLGIDVASSQFNIKLPSSLDVPNLPSLNLSQLYAVETALKSPLTLIQGPPGTGKTVTSATIVYHLNKLNSKNKILVCAPSNVAVDHLTEKLVNMGLKVVRITAKSKEDVDSDVKQYCLHEQVKSSASNEFRKLINMKEEFGELNVKETKTYYNYLKRAERKLIAAADVICCTCVGANDKRLSNLSFSSVLVDESTQASEPECLIPIVKGAKQVILVGDHQQLGPVILNKRASDAGLRQSLFERLILLGHTPIRLEVQYRMHPCLSEFPSNMFYDGSLQNGITNADRTVYHSTFPWPIRNIPMMFWATYGREELSNSGTSYLNRVEAMNIEKIVTKLIKDGISPSSIGIITPYEGQRNYILQYLQLNSTYGKDVYNEIEVVSVDAFQGREKDYIILSCVRANTQQQIGFLRDPRRLNVALTRARYGLVIVGNPKALAKDKLWNNLLTFYRATGCLVEGTIDNLQLSSVQLSRPREVRDHNTVTENVDNNDNNSDAETETGTVVSTAHDDHVADSIRQLTQQFGTNLAF